MQIRLSFYTIMCNRAKERDCLAAAFLCNTNIRLGQKLLQNCRIRIRRYMFIVKAAIEINRMLRSWLHLDIPILLNSAEL